MPKISLILLILLLLILPSQAQDIGECSSRDFQSELDSFFEDFQASSNSSAAIDLHENIHSLIANCLAEESTSNNSSNEDAVDLSTLEIEAGSPDEICEQATPALSPNNRSFDEAEEVLEQAVDYQAIFCTDEGAIYFELFEEEAPITVNNMVFLAQNNFYNNTIFHRVIPDFMAQGGDPTGTGRGGPAYQFEDETDNNLAFDRPYLLAMANAGPNTNGSQFFITFVETPWLDGAHTIFGEVISGQDVVDSILIRDPSDANAPATTLLAVVIVSPEQVNQ